MTTFSSLALLFMGSYASASESNNNERTTGTPLEQRKRIYTLKKGINQEYDGESRYYGINIINEEVSTSSPNDDEVVTDDSKTKQVIDVKHTKYLLKVNPQWKHMLEERTTPRERAEMEEKVMLGEADDDEARGEEVVAYYGDTSEMKEEGEDIEEEEREDKEEEEQEEEELGEIEYDSLNKKEYEEEIRINSSQRSAVRRLRKGHTKDYYER